MTPDVAAFIKGRKRLLVSAPITGKIDAQEVIG